MSLSEYLSAPVLEGQRNHALFSAVMQAREQGWDEWQIRTTIGAKAEADGLRQSEINSTIASAMRREILPKNYWDDDEDSPGIAYSWDQTFIPAPSRARRQPEQEAKIIDPDWVQPVELDAPTDKDWDPVSEVRRYLSALFRPEEYVGYVMDSFLKDGKYLPASRGYYQRTAGELLSELDRYKDIGKALGDYDPAAGAWIRFNPLNGSGVRAADVTAYRYALVECDDAGLTPEKQAALYRELRLPIAAMVHSGLKSMHAIVSVDAKDYDEYRKRVDFLHLVCRRSGIKIDKACKDPSRLSRLPGVMRNGERQWLVETNIGEKDWEAWEEFVAELNDDLPEFEQLSTVWNDMPELAPPLIDGILRQGHKMLLAGASKAGKSFMLLELAIAIAEGRDWLGWKCTRGKVLYVNLELDRASCLQRIRTLYDSMRFVPANLHNITLWHLRGQAESMDRLAPKLIRRARAAGFKLIILDPIYKALTGDENSAHEMAVFTSFFDRIAHETGASVVFCHHHSKGEQGQKTARDRASGSGVFQRDPDALLDLIELRLTPEQRRNIEEKYDAEGSPLGEYWTAWRVEGAIREFPPLQQTRFFFDYPLHFADDFELLTDAKAAGERQQTEKKQSTRERLKSAYAVAYARENNGAPVGDIAGFCGVSVATIKRWASETKHYRCDSDGIIRDKDAQNIHDFTEAIKHLSETKEEIHITDVSNHLNISEKTARMRAKIAGYSITNSLITQ